MKWFVFSAFDYDGGDMKTFDTEDEARAEAARVESVPTGSAYIVEGWDRT